MEISGDAGYSGIIEKRSSIKIVEQLNHVAMDVHTGDTY